MSPVLRRSLLPLLGLLAASPAAAGDLSDAVPSDAYLYVHCRDVPGGEPIDAYFDEVARAVIEARFDESIVDIMVTVSPQGEAEKIRRIHEVLVDIVGQVPWSEIGSEEFVFAEAMRAHANNFGSVILVASDLRPEAVPSVHRGLLQLSLVAANLGDGLIEDGVELQLVVSEQGEREVYTADALAEQGMQRVGRPGTTLEYVLDVAGHTVAVLAFQEETMVAGLNLGCRELVTSSLALLRGEPGVESLTGTRRFRETTAKLPTEGAASTFYMDFPNMFRPVQDFVYGILVKERAEPRWFNLVEDVFALTEVLDSVASVTHYDGYRQVDTTLFQWADDPTTTGNPLYLATKGREPVDELLEMVPAEATSFTVHGGADLLPLYHWAQDMVREYVPRGEMWLGHLRGIEALFAIDIEQDVLDYLGSPFVSVDLPPAPEASGLLALGENIMLQRVDDPERLRRLDERCETMLEAWLPMLRVGIQERARGNPMMAFELEAGEPLEAYPGVKEWTLSVPMMGRVPIVTGYVGDLAVTASSQRTLDAVMAARRGEAPRLVDQEHMAGLLPDGPIASASMIRYEEMLQGLVQGLNMAGTMVNILAGALSDDEQAANAVQACAGMIPKVARVLQSLDFLDRTVTVGEVPQGDGLSCVSRSTTIYKTPEERVAWR